MLAQRTSFSGSQYGFEGAAVAELAQRSRGLVERGDVGCDEFRLQAAKKDKSPSLTFSLDAFNILNRVNYQNYVGSLSSPFYGQAVATQPARRLQAGLRLQF